MHSKRILLPLSAGLSVGSCAFTGNATGSAAAACQTFSQEHPDLTFFGNSSTYTTLNEDFWSAQAALGPACIFAPTSASLMGYAVQTLKQAGVKFAVRGGGHMPIAGAANIDSTGVLLSSSNLNQLVISADNSTIGVGPGNRWGAVYDVLEPTGRTIVGGRLGVVGVPGFLLGGGISFFGNEYGWASANIASYEAVLANGTVVNATANNEHSDLFWALRGGGNNFAIVTNFEMKTVPAPAVGVGEASYGTGSAIKDKWLDAVFDFAHDGILDQKSAVIPTVTLTNSTGPDPEYVAFKFYNGPDPAPAALRNFSAPNLNATKDTFAYRSMANWSAESVVGFDQVHGLRSNFHIVSLVANRAAMGVVHDIYFAAAAKMTATVPAFVATLAFMPISRSYIVNGRGEDPLGDPFGIDANKAPYIWIEESLLWARSEDDAKVAAFVADVNAQIDAALAEMKAERSPYLYLNDADWNQPVFEGYGAANLQKLKEVRAKYDHERVYTDLMPGGFKLEGVKSGTAAAAAAASEPVQVKQSSSSAAGGLVNKNNAWSLGGLGALSMSFLLGV